MTAHTTFDHEIDFMLEALDCLFPPNQKEYKGMDDRTAYQRIFHTLHEIKERSY